MGKRIDMIGKTFGNLTVMQRVDDKIYKNGGREPQYLCACKCGNEIVKEGRSLRNAKTILSCGCTSPSGVYIGDPAENLVGQKFGKLTVVSKAKGDKWNCVCECKNSATFSRTELKLGQRKSCGLCSGQFRDLTGMRFGRLLVLHRVDNDKTRHVQWLCQCDCNNKTIVRTDPLVNGTQLSCGCYKSDVLKAKDFRIYNSYDLTGDYGIGYCSNNDEEFYFDKEDYELIKDYTWRQDQNGYIVASLNVNDEKTCILLHRLVMGVDDKDGYIVDHIGHNLKDNRKEFLRIVSYSQNMMNRKLPKNNTSGVSGVYYCKRDNLWYARITINGETINLGCYSLFEDAVKARKIGEEKYFGEYSYDNSIKSYDDCINLNQCV